MGLSQCKVAIPQILLVMLFLWALHSRYSDLLEQFCTCFKSIEHATIDSIVDDVMYHNGFTLHKRKGAKPPTSAPCVPAAASANTDQKGNVWHTPFEWLSKSFSKKSIKIRWTRALAGTGICPICHCKDKPWHIPPNCPLLKELHLKLEVTPSDPTVQPAAQQSTAAPTPSPPCHVGPTLAANESLADGSSGSGHAPSGMLASTSNSLPRIVIEYNSDDDFCWAGDKDGINYGVN
jgi:hypothetical protein